MNCFLLSTPDRRGSCNSRNAEINDFEGDGFSLKKHQHGFCLFIYLFVVLYTKERMCFKSVFAHFLF